MKGVILAGGTGSRLLPLTTATNKHLLPVGRKPMIYYSIEQLVGAGIEDILIVTGIDHMGDIVQTLGSGKNFGCHFTYRVQDTAGGIAQALGLARGFCYGERVCVLLGDNLFGESISPIVREYQDQMRGSKVVLKKVSSPTRYGVAFIGTSPGRDGTYIKTIIEKPSADVLKARMDSGDVPYAVTGLYFYDYRIFDIISCLQPSSRNELEITDVNNSYLESGALTYSVISGWWTDAGTHESLAQANQLVSGYV